MAQLSVAFYTEMALITLNDNAPEVSEDEPLTFSFGNAEPFKLSNKDASFETDDVDLVATAANHSWLKVEQVPEKEHTLATEQANAPNQSTDEQDKVTF